jgi:thiamine pyrophosphate-dependent acetolactate synthase large subunit-like protein
MSKLQRKEVLLRLAQLLDDKDIVVAALAGTTNECFHTMHRPGNLYLVGMGMVTPVAFGLARALPKRRIIALDTDGSQLLAPSIFSVIGACSPKNLCMIVFDNEQLYGTRGGPMSQTAHGTDLAGLAKAAGVGSATTVNDLDSFTVEYSRYLNQGGPTEIVCKIDAPYTRGEGPNFNGQENKFRLVRFIEETEGIKVLGGSV